jgi:hypothetical protein
MTRKGGRITAKQDDRVRELSWSVGRRRRNSPPDYIEREVR